MIMITNATINLTASHDSTFENKKKDFVSSADLVYAASPKPLTRPATSAPSSNQNNLKAVWEHPCMHYPSMSFSETNEKLALILAINTVDPTTPGT
jgi:hypothetical protein